MKKHSRYFTYGEHYITAIALPALDRNSAHLPHFIRPNTNIWTTSDGRSIVKHSLESSL